ncbi:MAG: MFS transporter [Chthoniobacteraceae bacterium]
MRFSLPKTITLSSQACDVKGEPRTGETIWTCGTLRYTSRGLFILFFWLMWNDFFLMLMESVQPALTGLLLKDNGATNNQLALVGTITTVFTVWINPVVSTWSDRTRTRWGRRRPFLLLVTPPAALFLAAIPWAPKAWHALVSMPCFSANFGNGSVNGAVLAITICTVLFGMFNSVLMAIFWYFFWDVVPEAMLGRFNAISKIVTTVQTFVWNYWLFGFAENYMTWVFGGIAILFFLAYTASVLAVKEGEYPPPEERPKGSPLAAVRTYAVECYSNPYYLWIFAGFACYQLGNVSNMFRLFHWRDTLGLNLDTIGKMQAWPALVVVVLAYPLGSLIDRLGPMRLMAPSLAIWSVINVLSFFFLKSATSLLICFSAISLATFMNSICSGVLTAEVFPREKRGQFCSANQLAHSLLTFVATPLAGMFFDYVQDYTYVYAMSAFFQILSAILFSKVYFNWRQINRNVSQTQAV